MADCMEDEKILTPRPLTPEELALLNWLLEHGLPEAKSFAPQVENISATRWHTGESKCGCPSISLYVKEDTPLGTCSSNVISDFVGVTPEGKKVGLLLFQKNGKLDLLEEYELDVMEGDWGFPVIDSLEEWQKTGKTLKKIGEKWVEIS
jgi:hypothetical protein